MLNGVLEPPMSIREIQDKLNNFEKTGYIDTYVLTKCWVDGVKHVNQSIARLEA